MQEENLPENWKNTNEKKTHNKSCFRFHFSSAVKRASLSKFLSDEFSLKHTTRKL